MVHRDAGRWAPRGPAGRAGRVSACPRCAEATGILAKTCFHKESSQVTQRRNLARLRMACRTHVKDSTRTRAHADWHACARGGRACTHTGHAAWLARPTGHEHGSHEQPNSRCPSITPTQHLYHQTTDLHRGGCSASGAPSKRAFQSPVSCRRCITLINARRSGMGGPARRRRTFSSRAQRTSP